MKWIGIVLLAGLWRAAAAAEFDLDKLCLDCHRPGQARGEVPRIEGQHREYLEHQLLRFRERHRDSFPMSALTGGLGDGDIASIAESLSLRTWVEDAAAVSAQAVPRGRAAAQRHACASCHQESFLGAGDVPRLAGQQPGYLARQLAAFGEGRRYHPPTGTGSPMRALSADEASDLAAFLHALGATAPGLETETPARREPR